MRVETSDIHVAALARGAERYVVLYSSSNRIRALRVLGKWAANPDL